MRIKATSKYDIALQQNQLLREANEALGKQLDEHKDRIRLLSAQKATLEGFVQTKQPDQEQAERHMEAKNKEIAVLKSRVAEIFMVAKRQLEIIAHKDWNDYD